MPTARSTTSTARTKSGRIVETTSALGPSKESRRVVATGRVTGAGDPLTQLARAAGVIADRKDG